MDYTERPITDAVHRNLLGCAADAAALLGDSTATAADRFVDAVRRGTGPPGVDPADVPYLLGSLWGERVVAAHGWSWAELTLNRHAGVTALAVVAPDRSLAAFPVHAVAAALADPDAELLLAAAMVAIGDGSLDGFTPGGYADVFDHVFPSG